MEAMSKITKNTRQLVNVAYVRDGDKILTGSALLLAVLLHSKSEDRNSADGELVRKIMKDANL